MKKLKENKINLKIVLRIISWLLNIVALNNFLFIAIDSQNIIEINIKYKIIYSAIIGVMLLVNLLIIWIQKKFNLAILRYYLLDIFAIALILLQTNMSIFFFWFYISGRQIISFIRKFSKTDNKSIYFQLSRNPAFFFILSFIFTIFLGTIFLMLPVSTVKEGSLGFIDALFTSTSATCVTGLVIESTGNYFSQFGQIVIILLIQIGGLGIMTISTAFAIILGQKLTMKSENLMQNLVGESNRLDMITLVKNILLVTFVIESIGAVILYMTFRHDTTISSPVYNSIFHSISAFCNAGFSLYDNSFENYYSNPNINFIIPALIILGGLGFSVIMDIRKNIISRFNPIRLAAHTKIVLITTLLLISSGFFLYFFTEYNSTMKDFSPMERIFASFFQSVTTRTAGFNTIPNGELSDSSFLITNFLMFIGASPGSTGGGVKTTALAVIILTVFSIMRSSSDVTAFQRKIQIGTIKKVLALISIALSFLFFSVLILMIIKPENIQTKSIIFEAVSAFGTVGLSMGITSSLNFLSKSVIIFLMFFGRIGPLTIIFAISKRVRSNDIQYTNAKLGIG